MRKKKEIPLEVLQALSQFFEKKENHYKLVDPKKSILKVIDTDIDSNFYFEIENTSDRNGKNTVQVTYKPKDSLSTVTYSRTVNVSELGKFFDAWSRRIVSFPFLGLSKNRLFSFS
nr:hypothetical protein [uncultured Draconibacterium sp.]